MGRNVNYADLDFEQYGWKDADIENLNIAEAAADVVNRRMEAEHIGLTNTYNLPAEERILVSQKYAQAQARLGRAEFRLRAAIRHAKAEAGPVEAQAD